MATSLPNELWDDIIGRLPRADLPNLSLVSKHLHKLTNPILYQEVDTHKHKGGYNNSLVCFFRTIVRNPKLALHIKQLNLHAVCRASHMPLLEGGGYPLASLDVFSTTTKEDRVKLQRQMVRSKLDMDYLKTWYRAMFSPGNFDAVSAYILFLTFNLESVTIVNYGVQSSHPYTQYVLSYRPFSKLRSAALYKNEVAYQSTYLRFANLLPYLAKDIAHLSALGVSDSSFLEHEHRYPLTSLALINCRVTNDSLSNFLKLFPTLTKLEWYEASDAVDSFYKTISTLPVLKSHLQQLIIDDNHANVLQIELSDFTALRTLTVDAKTAFGKLMTAGEVRRREGAWEEDSDIEENPSGKSLLFQSQPYPYVYPKRRVAAFRNNLPESLESLSIRYCAFAVWLGIRRFLKHKGDKLMKLKGITFSFPDPSYVPAPVDLVRYDSLAEKNGVTIFCEVGGYRQSPM